MVQPPKKSAKERAYERLDIRRELDELEKSLSELKVLFEQYFTGILHIAPEAEHVSVKRKIRTLLKAPFKNSEMSFRLKSLEGRYHTFNTYWQRVLKQREEGTYHRDVFKANLRARQALEDATVGTTKGMAQKSIQELFKSYKSALEKMSGKKQELDYQAFQKSIVQRAKDFKEKNKGKKLSFKVVVQDGKVSIRAKVKEKAQPAPSDQ